MNQSQPKNPLHGITLKAILEYLVAEYGWERLGQRINIHCFNDKPSINSSLKFLRKTDWARTKVERLYLYSISYEERHGKKKTDANAEQPDTNEKQPDANEKQPDAIEKQSETRSVWDRARED